MRRIRDWSLRARLLLAFAGVLIPFLAIAGLSMVWFRTLTESFSHVQEEAKLEMKRTSDVISVLNQSRFSLLRLLPLSTSVGTP